MQYWLDLFTPETWAEAASIGFRVTGFRETRWPTVQKIQPGDTFVCYLARRSSFNGLLEAVSLGFLDRAPIWRSDPFPARVKTRPIIALGPDAGIPFDKVVSKLSSATSWRGYIRGSPMLLPPTDGEAIVDELERASVQADIWKPTVSVKESATSDLRDVEPATPTLPSPTPAERPHTAMQWLLIRIGKALGLDVHVARNDRGLSYEGHRFAEATVSSLPPGFEPLTKRVLELIDVLWIERNQIVCAFEVEQSTEVYSGLLRMSDLLAVQRHTNIRLYIVAPDDRRSKVVREINRPTFFYLDPSLYTVCKFLPYSQLESAARQTEPFLRHLRYEFIDELAETCVATPRGQDTTPIE